jgi:mono/diheme cytochrome c family protein
MKRKLVWLFAVILPLMVRGIDTGAHTLTWDAFEKSYVAKPGEEEAKFTFTATNKSDHPSRIVRTATSCHCTAAVQPRDPWIIEPGASDELTVLVDLRSRRGGLTKTIYVETSDGEEMLLVHVQVPPPPAIQREMNMMLAQSDRQAVFRGDCASCHVTPTVGKKGAELFTAACLICHGAVHRATMVPDLMKPKTERTAAFWEQWIRHGGEGTLMPAFAREHGGPLDDEQIKSLVEYLITNLPKEPAKETSASN